MKRILLALGLWLSLVGSAFAQCIGVSGIGSVPVVGVTCDSEPVVATYSAAAIGLVTAASATDIACLTGSATKVVRIQRIRVSGTAGSIRALPILITKHTSANTAGTPATGTALPVPYRLVSTDPAPTATTTSWTANPTINDSTPGLIGVEIVALNLVGTPVGPVVGAIMDWETRR